MIAKSVTAIAPGLAAKPVPMPAPFLFALEIAPLGAEFSQGREITATNPLKMCYQLVAGGLNRDGRSNDMSERGSQVRFRLFCRRALQAFRDSNCAAGWNRIPGWNFLTPDETQVKDMQQ